MEHQHDNAEVSSLSPEEPQQVSPAVRSAAKEPHKGHKLLMVAIAGMVAVLLLAVIALSINAGSSTATTAVNANNHINTKEYQALFLTNGQVYFGKIGNLNDKYVTMSNIYYLQVQQAVQPAAKTDASQVSLAKLGSELHGPEDKMYIASDQVLFWENLKNDSKVSQAIAKYQNQ